MRFRETAGGRVIEGGRGGRGGRRRPVGVWPGPRSQDAEQPVRLRSVIRAAVIAVTLTSGDRGTNQVPNALENHKWDTQCE